MNDTEIKKLAGQLYDRLHTVEKQKTEDMRDTLEGILLLANNYTMHEGVRLALIAQRCRDALK